MMPTSRGCVDGYRIRKDKSCGEELESWAKTDLSAGLSRPHIICNSMNNFE